MSALKKDRKITVFLRVLLIFVIAGLGFLIYQNIPTQSQKASNNKTVNFKACKRGEGYRESVGLGSTYLIIKKDLIFFCEVEISNEIEGGYKVSKCRVPKSVGEITFRTHEFGSDFSPIEKYCKEIKSGNVFLEMRGD